MRRDPWNEGIFRDKTGAALALMHVGWGRLKLGG
jgi:hypothetical protein